MQLVFKASTGRLDPRLQADTVLLKGPEGVGRSADGALPQDEAFAWCRQAWPDTQLIVSGGIHGHEQVVDYLTLPDAAAPAGDKPVAGGATA